MPHEQARIIMFVYYICFQPFVIFRWHDGWWEEVDWSFAIKLDETVVTNKKLVYIL